MQKNGSSGSRDGTRNSSEDYHTPILTQKEEETSPNHKSSGGSSMKNDSSIDYQSPPKSSSSGVCSRFSSQNSSKFPPASPSTNNSVSLTAPSSYSSSSDGDYNELKIRNELRRIHLESMSRNLESASRKVEILRKQKEDLLLVNKALKNRLFALVELRLSIRDNGGGSSTNNRVGPSLEADPVTSPTSVIGNINQGFESFDDIRVQFQSEEEGVSSPNSISFRSIVSFLNQPNSAGTDSTACTDSFNTNTNRLRFAATPSVPETVPRMQLPIIPAVDESKNGGVDEVDPLELDLY